MNTKTAKSFWGLFLFASIGIGLACLIAASLSFNAVKILGDTISKDGDLALLTPARFNSIRIPVRVVGLLMVAFGTSAVIWKRRFISGTDYSLSIIKRLLRDFWKDLQVLLGLITDVFRDRSQLLVLAIILLIAIGLRWVYLARPTWHDEAYTYLVFASQPLRHLVSDYHLPNNHIFHSILVHFSTRIFGCDLWAIRLPVIIAGVLLVPSGYLLARLLYNRKVALSSAALIAAAPILIDHSTNARGYVILALITLLICSLGVILLERSNLAAWTALVLLSAVGFYTIPVMLFPFGMVWTWLAVAGLMKIIKKDCSEGYRLIIALIVSGLATVILTCVFYLPVFLKSGFDVLVSNSFVSSLGWSEFIQTLPGRLSETWVSWNTAIPPLVGYLFVAGFFTSFLLHRKLSRVSIPLQIAAVIWIILLLIIQRPNAWARIWTFLIPLVLIWGAAGVLGSFTVLQAWIMNSQKAASILAAVIIVFSLGASTIRAAQFYPYRADVGEAEAITLYLKDRLQPGDIVVVSIPEDVNIEYYFQKHDLPVRYNHDVKKYPFTHAYVIVNPGYGQTVESVLDERGPDLVFFDMSTSEMIGQWGFNTLYEVFPYLDRVEKAYGALKAP